MNIDVLGCHGGSSLHHRQTTFLINQRVALDAGALSDGLTLEQQRDVRGVLVTHAHMDHISGLASLVEHRSHSGDFPLVVAARQETIDALKAHYFNEVLWPDFTAIALPGGPAIELRVLELDSDTELLGLRVRAIAVDHSIPACGFLVSDGQSTVAYTGDTGPTDRFWQALEQVEDLRAVITEVSFPNRLLDLARVSKHHVPSTLRDEVAKLRRRHDVPVLLYHLKPAFEAEIRSELDAMALPSVRVLTTGERLQF